LTGPDGTTYQVFRGALRPRWWRVWSDLAITWLALAALVAGLVVLDARFGSAWALAFVPLAAVGIGLLLHHISSFLHEAAHFNLAPTRVASDRLTNLVVGPLVLMDIRSYRVVHLAHHRFLGTTRDTETSYFRRPDALFLLRSLTGASVLEVLRSRDDVALKQDARHLVVPLAGVCVHGAVVVAAVLTGYFWLAAAWFLGVFSVYPMFNALRQNLEHRTDVATSDVDYREVDQGGLTRCFSDTPGGLVLGGVGFSRHLVHHWDPGLSYTNLGAAERFLRSTAAAPVLAARSTTYWRTLRELSSAR
jgi:fatty acid desaturase